MRATKKFDHVDITMKLAVTTEELQTMLSCGRQSAVDMGERAEAKIQIGKRVFWNVGKVRDYLDLISA